MKFDVEEILSVAEKVALKSQCRYKVSCVLVDRRGNIVATGYNHRIGRRMLGKPSIHAEMDALNKVRKPSTNLTAFIYRKNGRAINPCKSCAALLKAYGIKTVFVTQNTHWERIDEETVC